MHRIRTSVMGSVALATLLGYAVSAFQAAPAFEVDPMWPKPLPNHWLLGSVTGVAVDAQDHIWVVHRGADSLHARREMGAATNPKTAEECCIPAPQVLEFDAAGNLISHWGGPGQKFQWPVSPGGIAVDKQGHLWITAAGPPEIPGSANATVSTTSTSSASASTRSGTSTATTTTTTRGDRRDPPPPPQDAHVLKFSRKGEFLLQIGKAGVPGDNGSSTGLNRPAGVDLDPTGSELYVADGFGNQRIAVFDAATGAHKRHWGGPPDGTFKTPSCVKVAKDGTVYVCDRGNNRVQAFDKNGKFLKRGVVSAATKGTGSVWDLAFSSDPQQRFIYVAAGHDQKIFILRRDTLEAVGSFGDGGRYPGTFYSVGSIAVDSRGNIYTGETLEGKRVQKFLRKGAGR